MQTPLEFLDVFRSTLRSAGITFAVTSGMACIRYGLQQTTKDSDWIVAAEDLPKLRGLLQQCERRMPPWVVQYRAWALMPDAERDRAIATRPRSARWKPAPKACDSSSCCGPRESSGRR